jgi:quercetin dioxygenase-like cupin family protein
MTSEGYAELVESSQMKLLKDEKSDLRPVAQEHFAGKASVALVMESDEGIGVRVYRVSFQAGSRTNWHFHTGVQMLLVEKGKGRVQKEGEAIQEIQPGDVVYVVPGEKHWHGASPEQGMTHLAVNIGVRTEWLKRVTDEQYFFGLSSG